MLQHIDQTPSERPKAIRFLYGTRLEPGMGLSQILFLPQLQDIFERASASRGEDWSLDLFVTGGEPDLELESKATSARLHTRRIEQADLTTAFGPVGRRSQTVAYVCGPPAMTDQFVAEMERLEGMEPSRVMCEKWW